MFYWNDLQNWFEFVKKKNRKYEPYPPQERSIAEVILFPLPLDRSFEDDDSVDGNRSSSTQAAFKVPKVPKKPADSSAARRPSATGGKLGKKTELASFSTKWIYTYNRKTKTSTICDRIYQITLESEINCMA